MAGGSGGVNGNYFGSTYDPLMGKAQGLPYDIQEKQSQLARRRKLVDAMVQAGMGGNSSPTVDAGTYKVANFADPIKQLVSAYLGEKMGRDVDKESADVALDYNKRLATGAQDYINTRQGGQPQAIGQDTRALDESGAEGAPPTAYMPSKADPIKAIVNAMGTGIAPLQSLGMEDLKLLGTKGTIQSKDWLGLASHYDVPSILAAMKSGDPQLLKPKTEIKVSGDHYLQDQGGQVTGQGGMTTYGPPGTIPGTNVPGQADNTTGKYTGLQGGNTTPAGHLQQKLSDASVAQLVKGRDDYMAQQNSLKTIGQLSTDIAPIDPSKFGTGAELRTNVIKAGELLGMKPGQENGLMQNVHAGLGHLMIEKVRALAPVTKEDVSMMQSIVGSESNTKVALEKILAIAEQRAAQAMDSHRKFVAGFEGQGGIDDFEKFRQQWAPDMQFTTIPASGPQQMERPPVQRAPGAADPLGLFNK